MLEKTEGTSKNGQSRDTRMTGTQDTVRRQHLLLSYICIGKDQLREHLCSPPVFVLSVLLIILVFCVVSLCFACLRTVSCVPVIRVSLDCPFLLVPSEIVNVYFFLW
jgi:hypothetical protein